jgi:AcrR family transcriptional regulator
MADTIQGTDSLRALCIAEARAIIAEQGIEKLSIRAVARNLGVSHQAPYRHFASREALLAEVVADAFDSFADHLESRPLAWGDAMAGLAGLGRAYLEYAASHAFEYRLMFAMPLPDADRHPRLMAAARRSFDVLKRCVRSLDTATDPDRTTLDALFIWSMIHGMASMFQSSALQTIEMPPGLLGRLSSHVDGRMRGAFGLGGTGQAAAS